MRRRPARGLACDLEGGSWARWASWLMVGCVFFGKKWRREWDSNPRKPCGSAVFQDRPIRPLWHPSAAILIVADIFRLLAAFWGVAGGFFSGVWVGLFPLKIGVALQKKPSFFGRSMEDFSHRLAHIGPARGGHFLAPAQRPVWRPPRRPPPRPAAVWQSARAACYWLHS